MRTAFHAMAVLIVCAAHSAAVAQLRPSLRASQPVTDPANVIDDRGSPLEVFPAQRATPITSGVSRQVTHKISAASASAPINARSLGVVFNHAMQVQGYITGEVTFKIKGVPTGFDPALYPGLTRLAGPDVYLVTARTPGEFAAVTRRLQKRADVEWTEPVVIYAGPQSARTPFQ